MNMALVDVEDKAIERKKLTGLVILGGISWMITAMRWNWMLGRCGWESGSKNVQGWMF